MNKQTITFTASEQTLTKTGGIEHYASNIVSYIEASFTLGDNWAGYDSIRAVWESGYARIATVLDANNKCIVPAEVLTYKSKVNVNLVGSIVENTVLTDRLTTYPILALTVDADARVDSSETTPVTATQFEQFVDVVRDEASAIQNYTYDSEAWAVGQRAGVDVPSTDETYQNNAKYYADQGATLQQEVSDLKSDISLIYNRVVSTSASSDFTSTTLYKTDGTTTTLSQRASTDYIPCDGVEKISFKLAGISNPALALVSFFDSSKNFIGSIPAPNGNVIEKKNIYIPQEAKYLRGVWQTTITSASPYIYLYYTNSELGKIEERVDSLEKAFYSEIDLNPSFTNTSFIWYSDGTKGYLSQRGSSEYLKCVDYSFIKYKLQAFNGVSPETNVISFFDADLTYISGVKSTANATVEGIAVVPTGAVYCCGSYLQSTISTLYMRGVVANNAQAEIGDLYVTTDNILPTVTSIVNQTMSKKEFLTAVNAKWADYATLCLCHSSSFRVFSESISDLYTWEDIYKMININFRWDVWKEGMTYDLFCKRVNVAFTMPIKRFEDAVLNDSTPCDFSLKFTDRSGEPSALVSEDGSTLYVYAFQKRFSTYDGVYWNEPETLVYDSEPVRPEHYNCNLIDGIYYIIGRDNGASGYSNDLRLWTSTDGINFTHRGILLPMGYEFVDDDAVTGWGNSYLIKQNGTFYLYIEYTTANIFWEFSLVTCTDIFNDNGDGTIGNWTNYSGNPIMGDHIYSNVDLNASGNPDFAKGCDNRPIRVDGKWYMYFHTTFNGDMILRRAYSDDLCNWTLENGRVFDNRDIPTDGHSSAANGDHALIEFKGRTYLFYTFDLNTLHTPYIHYMIDDRPFREILKMYP